MKVVLNILLLFLATLLLIGCSKDPDKGSIYQIPIRVPSIWLPMASPLLVMLQELLEILLKLMESPIPLLMKPYYGKWLARVQT
jgi:hypothetical protein